VVLFAGKNVNKSESQTIDKLASQETLDLDNLKKEKILEMGSFDISHQLNK